MHRYRPLLLMIIIHSFTQCHFDKNLFFAAKNNMWNLFDNLITESAVSFMMGGTDYNINFCDENGDTILHYLVKSAPLHILEKFFHFWPDINALNKQGISPLFLAIINQNYTLVNLLLKKKADPNIPSDYGLPLHYAIQHLEVKIVKLLLDYGAQPNLKDYHKITAVDRILRLIHIKQKKKVTKKIKKITQLLKNYQKKNFSSGDSQFFSIQQQKPASYPVRFALGKT